MIRTLLRPKTIITRGCASAAQAATLDPSLWVALERTFVSYKTIFGIAGIVTAGAGGAVAINQWATHIQIEKAKAEIQKDLNGMNQRFDRLESLLVALTPSERAQEKKRWWLW